MLPISSSRSLSRHWPAVMVLALVLPVSAIAQSASSKRPLTHDDYDSWKTIRGSTISADGRWVAYEIRPQEGDGELVVRNVQGTVEHLHERGTGVSFSRDNRYVLFQIAPTEEEMSEARRARRRGPDLPQNKLAIQDLRTGEVTVIDRVRTFRLPEERGAWIAYHHAEPQAERRPEGERARAEEERTEPVAERPQEEQEDERDKDYGTRMVLRNLGSGAEATFESVMEYRFTRDGEWLLFTVSSKDEPETDGVYALRPGQEEPLALLTGKGNYRRWTLNEEQTFLAFLTDRDDYQAEEPTFNLYAWKVGDPQARLWVSHTRTPGFPAGMSVSDRSGLSFTDDGGIIQFGIKEIPEPAPQDPEGEDAEEEPTATFELWSWNDPYPYPQQKQMVSRVRNETYAAVYHVASGRFVQLGDEALPGVSLSYDGKVAFGQSNIPYTQRISYDTSYYDVYIIDPQTGRRTEVIRENYFGASLSPEGRYVTWFGTDRHWYVYDVARRTITNITRDIPIAFWREGDDRPSHPGSHGTAGWTDNEAGLLLYDAFDIWEVTPDGSTFRCITEGFGRENDIQLRYQRMDRTERTITPNRPMLLRARNTETMASGFYQDQVRGTRAPQLIVMEERSIGTPTKADDADVYLFTRSRFNEFPDLWVSDTRFRRPVQVSNIGDQVNAFTWGSAELLTYNNADGVELKGILIKPDNYRPGQHPTMVYIYERLSQGLHSFRNPGPGTSINVSYYVSNGYLVWMPDIVYELGQPGVDALKCVEPSVQMLIDAGIAAAGRVGIQGHSWGGYQISYMVTQTDIFAAAEAGAPVSNMTSAYGGIRWGSGMVRQFQYERTQSRLGRHLWNGGLNRYLENSPLFYLDRVNTPLLILHNDRDDAVPWYQGIELIMGLRRLEKPAWMFNYNDELHGLRQRVNQKDFTIRMQQFFDHYLKGTSAPKWMIEGIPAWATENGR